MNTEGKATAWCERARFRGVGFTLIEMIVTIAILGIIGAITIRYVVAASALYVSVQSYRDASDEAVAALGRMRREARSWKTTLSAEANRFSFENRAGATTEFALSGSDLRLNGNNLATGVERFELTYFNATNGLLAPLPLNSTGRAAARRVAVEMTVTKGDKSAQLNVSLFYPRGMVTR